MASLGRQALMHDVRETALSGLPLFIVIVD